MNTSALATERAKIGAGDGSRPRVPRERPGAWLRVPFVRESASIERSISVQLGVQTALLLMLLCTMVWAGVDRLLQSQHDERWRANAGAIAELIQGVSFLGEAHMLEQLRTHAPHRPGTFLVVVRADGTELYRDPERTFALVASGPEIDFVIGESASTGGSYLARLSLDRADDRRMLARLALLLSASALLGGVVAALTAAWCVRQGLAPLQELARQARAIDARRAGQRLNLGRRSEELQGTVDQFNALMGRLESAQRQLEAYNGNVAHELRGLLAALIVPAELALSRQRSTEALREALAANVEGLRALAATVDDMLFLARVEHGAAPRRGSPRSLAALAREVLEFHDAALEEARLQAVVDGDAEIAVDAPLFKRAVSNLISNATRYARRGTLLRLEISLVQDRAARIVVKNEGPPIDGAMMSRIFDRFVRAEAGGSVEGSNHGLGLAIVAAVARMHGGEPYADSASGVTCVGFSVRGDDR